MATFKGIVSYISAVQNGTSKAGKAWSKVDVVLTYDKTKPEYPKEIAFSVMNDNIAKFNLLTGNEYELEVDFSVREHQGKHYMSATCWKATPTQQAPTQPVQQPVYQQVQPQAQTAPQADDLPF